ncbi:MAG: molybdate ABC transporter substrate-binding protein [Desulfotalea sp.]
MKTRQLLIIFFITLVCSTSIQAETIHLSVAASMTDAFKEIITVFTQENPSVKILPNFASSGSLAKQIYQGAPADIYVSANHKWMKYLKSNEMIANNSDHIFAYNNLVFIGAKNSTVTKIEDVRNLTRIAIGNPASVPAGQYAKQALDAVNLYAGLKTGKQLIMAKDVRQALLYADRGEVDGAFVYKTDALLARNSKILFTVPATLYNKISYPLALTNSGATKTTAKTFYDFTATQKCITILKKFGFKASL